MPSTERRLRWIDVRRPPSGGGSTADAATTEPVPPSIPAPAAPSGLTVDSTALLYSAVSPQALANLSWYAPPGLTPDAYVIQWALDSGFTSPTTRPTSGAATMAGVDGLPVGVAVYFRVAAVVRGVSGAWSNTASATMPSDTTAPAAPTSFGYAWSGLTGDLTITWTNPTSANFRDVRVRIYTHNGGTLLREVYAAGGLYVWTRGQHYADTSNTPDPSVYVVLTARSWGGVFSATDLTGSPTLAAPATPSGLATSWDGDLIAGVAAADLLITWTRSNAVADYEVRITGSGVVIRRVGLTDRYLYTFDQNAAENSGTAQATLTVAVYAVDALGQISALGASTSALNGPPPAAVLTSVFAGSSSVGLTIAASAAKDLLDYRIRVYKSTVLVDTLYVTSTRPTITIEDGDGSYQFDVSARDVFGQIGTASSLSSAVDLIDWDTFVDNLRAGAIYSDQLVTTPETLFDAYTDDNRSSGGISYALNASWVRWIRFERADRDRYRTITLAMAPAGGTTNWYIRTSEDAVTWSYFAGPVTSSRILTAVANAAAAQAAPVSAATLGNSSASRVDLPAITSARYIEVWLRNTTHATTVNEFYPRRLVQSDDLEAEAIKAVNIASDAILANHVNATSFVGFEFTGVIITGATIQTAASGERVVLDSTGLKTYDSAGNVVIEATTATDGALKAGIGAVTLNRDGQRLTSRTVSVWSTATPAPNTIAWVDGSGDTVGFIEGLTEVDEVTTPYMLISSGDLADTNITLAANGSVGLINRSGIGALEVFDTQVRATGEFIVESGGATIQYGLNLGAAAGAGTGEIRMSGGLNVNALGAGAGDIHLSGYIESSSFPAGVLDDGGTGVTAAQGLRVRASEAGYSAAVVNQNNSAAGNGLFIETVHASSRLATFRYGGVDRLVVGASGYLEIREMTAPATGTGARIYVDSADGDLKVKFGNGVVKTLATN
jgi:hypothetical protein